MSGVLSTVAGGIATTVGITLLSFVFGAILALPIVALRTSRSAIARAVGTVIVEGVRSVPPLVWLFLLYYGISNDLVELTTFQAAVGGFSVIAAVYLAETYRAAVQAIPRGQFEAAAALSLDRIPTLLRVTIPQAVLLAIPPAAGYAISLLKDTSAASIIGATDITFLANESARSTGDQLTPFLIATVLYLVLSIPIAALARAATTWIERRIKVS